MEHFHQKLVAVKSYFSDRGEIFAVYQQKYFWNYLIENAQPRKTLKICWSCSYTLKLIHKEDACKYTTTRLINFFQWLANPWQSKKIPRQQHLFCRRQAHFFIQLEATFTSQFWFYSDCISRNALKPTVQMWFNWIMMWLPVPNCIEWYVVF